MKSLQAFFDIYQFGINDIVDILIVTLLVYKLLDLIKGTRVIQMLWAVLFFFVLVGGAKLFKLQTLDMLLNNFIGYLFLSLVILFHPELRKGLAELGQKRWFNFLSSQTTSLDYLSELIDAMTLLKSNKVGALVAIERTIDLEKYITIGAKINAVINKDLIQTIFFPNTALHDGAIIIKENRVFAAGCVLPITKQENLDQRFGLRHRAALGLSEETDAIVIVVSEERGRISVAEEGVLKVDLEPDELEIYLKDRISKQ